VKELAHVILYDMSPEEYDSIDGITSIGKARNLMRMMRTGKMHSDDKSLPDYFRRHFAD
jgi:hypothetical protein